jgi:hypothetical protein
MECGENISNDKTMKISHFDKPELWSPFKPSCKINKKG